MLTFRQGLELSLALGGLAWVLSQAIGVLDPKPGPGLLGHYAIEGVGLSIAVVVALLLQLHHGKPHLAMLWFCLGMSAVMAALGAMYFGAVAAGSVAPAWTAGIMATVRVRGNWDRLLGWFWAGVGAQIVLMVVLLAGAAITRRMAAPSQEVPNW